MLIKGESYRAVYDSFTWNIPLQYNIGVDVCDKWADGSGRPALIYRQENGQVDRYTFDDLKRLSNRLANALAARGVGRGDRVGIMLPQCPETGLAHVALYKLGAVAVPLFTLFGPDALQYRLANCRAKGIITDGANLDKVMAIKEELPDLELVVQAGGGRAAGVLDFWGILDQASDELTPADTSAEDPAMIIYTSGTTGPPKGALHPHRVLLGHMPGVEFPHNFFPQPDDLFWTPADWAWAGGLLDVLLPSWHHGVPVLAFRAKKFDPEQAFAMIAEFRVKNSFLPPTALKMMRQVPDPRQRHDFALRSVGSGGETLGEGLLDWGREVLGLTVNEFYGQTEANLIVANCSEVMEIRPGSMGLAVPGHVVEVVDDEGNPVPPGQVGEVAVKSPDPVMFLEYWQNPDATHEKFRGDWALTGDMAIKDEDGYFWFRGRSDDLITSAGYRIGPAEIEDCLTKHPAVAMAGVIGAPDEMRGTIVKAFLVLKPDTEATPQLEEDIKNFVKSRLAAHEYPRALEFVENLPMTATGKIMRKDLRQREEAKKAG
ncbi:MAG: acyl-CoA synthetase [Proteobacteria bacterium]|nr:acyl-CoA synthetase [Pseudomonadota bacterium]